MIHKIELKVRAQEHPNEVIGFEKVNDEERWIHSIDGLVWFPGTLPLESDVKVIRDMFLNRYDSEGTPIYDGDIVEWHENGERLIGECLREDCLLRSWSIEPMTDRAYKIIGYSLTHEDLMREINNSKAGDGHS